MKGKGRCRLHGGANPGAPRGNQNAYKHGRYSRAVRDEIAILRALDAVAAGFLEGLDA